MTTSTRCRQLLVLLALTIGVCLAPKVAAAQDDAFKDGMKARDENKWGDVATLMRKAIQVNGQDSRRRVDYGGLFGLRKRTVEYLPNFYLGEALFKGGDCVGAVDAWTVAEKQGAIRASADLAREMDSGFSVCEAKGVLPPARFDQLSQRASRAYNDVQKLAEDVSSLAGQHSEEFGTDLREQYERGRRELGSARDSLTAATRSRSAKDFETALTAMDRARNIFVPVQKALGDAVEATRSAQSLARQVEEVLSGAEDLERQVESRVTGSKSALSGPLASIRQQGRSALSGARDRFSTGSKSANTQSLTEARALGQDAFRYYRQLLDELDRLDKEARAKQLQDAVSAAEQAQLLLEGLFTTLDRRVAANPVLVDGSVTAEQAAIRKDAETARRRLASARTASNIASIAQARQMTLQASERLNRLLGRFGPLSLREQGVSEALEEGARQFFAGAYDKALAALNAPDAVAPDTPLQLHVHLFRAASLHAKYAHAPKDESLRKQALAEVAECKKLDSAFEPDPRAFSPAFIRFFKSDNAGPSRGQS